MQEVRDLNEYIRKLEDWIVNAKIRKMKSKSVADFQVVFQVESMAENLRRYFSDRGYSVEIRKCQQCKHYDIIISWT